MQKKCAGMSSPSQMSQKMNGLAVSFPSSVVDSSLNGNDLFICSGVVVILNVCIQKGLIKGMMKGNVN